MNRTFTKQGAERAIEAAGELFEALPRSRKLDHAVALNELYLFLDAARAAAPDEEEPGISDDELAQRLGLEG